jgi:quinolinate synthase
MIERSWCRHIFLLILQATSTMKKDAQQLVHEIARLKEEKKITILAHYYQIPEIRQLADRVEILKLTNFCYNHCSQR